MAKYHETARKLREKYDIDVFVKTDIGKNVKLLNLILDLMGSCSQLRQRKVIESFFTECFKDVKTEFIDLEYMDRKYRKMVVIE